MTGVLWIGATHRARGSTRYGLPNDGIKSGSFIVWPTNEETRVVCPSCVIRVQIKYVNNGKYEKLLTALKELESVADDTLVAPKEETAILTSLPRLSLFRRNFRTKGNTTTDDTEGLGIVAQVTTRVSLAKVCGKRAANLSLVVIGEGIIKIVVTLGVSTQSRVILCRCQVHWGT